MILVMGTVRLGPGGVAAARGALGRMLAASRAEAGCVEYAYAEDVLDPGLIHVKELWRDRAALSAHFASPHLADWRAAWPALGIGDRRLALFEVGAPEPT